MLLIYHRPFSGQDAATVTEHIKAFGKYSQFNLWYVNTAFGFPYFLHRIRFDVLIFHYSLFGYPYSQYIPKGFLDYPKHYPSAYKIAFFQDEHHFCQARFSFLNQYRFDCVYTLVDPQYFDLTYKKYTRVKKLIYHIPGYVSEGLMEKALRFALPEERRTIDVGYRGRHLSPYMGKGAREKYVIGKGFEERTRKFNMVLDIEVEEHHRLYGDDWYRFLANSKACLGVEAGVSIFDIDDAVRDEYEKRITVNPNISFEELSDRVLCKREDNIPYRTISPRHFEAAAFRVCQILFEGKYSGIMNPMVHYIPLKKDFSNLHEVIRMFNDRHLRQEITENAYQDLIASGRYSYQRFIDGFDHELQRAGLSLDAVHPPAIKISLPAFKDRWKQLRLILIFLLGRLEGIIKYGKNRIKYRLANICFKAKGFWIQLLSRTIATVVQRYPKKEK